MGCTSGAIGHGGRAIILALVVAAGTVRADVTTEGSSSILVFPKVISNAPVIDTIIQISNTSNSMAYARCLYVNGALPHPTAPPSPANSPQCQEVDFDIFLTKQQPTHWVVSAGRGNGSTAPAGFDPGLIPPMWNGFTGELICIEEDSSGAPLNGNHFKGEATIVSADGDASKYNGIGIMGLNTDSNVNNGDDTLCLGGGVTPSCPTGAEYNACPDTLIVNHFGAGASDPAIDEFAPPGSSSNVRTEVTLVPCTEDFENQIPGQAVVQFVITNEFEEVFSTSSTLTCWANWDLGVVNPVFKEAILGSRFAQTRMYSATPDQPGILGVMEEFHSLSGANESRDALNLHGEDDRPDGDVIVLPGGF